jgi:hypothetical protein
MRASKAAAELMPVIARLEKGVAEDADVLRVSRAEITQAMAGVRGRVEAMCARPLLCADCGRKLSLMWGGVRDEQASETKA